MTTTTPSDKDLDALARALLAEQARTEPVAWVYWHPSDTTYDGPDTLHKKAVSRFTDDTRKAMMAKGWLFEPLYPASTAAQPLKAEQAKDAAEDAPCAWTQDADFDMGDTYASACGELWSFIDGGPTENRVRFCHGCGKPVQVFGAARAAERKA